MSQATGLDDLGTLYGRFYDNIRKIGKEPEVGQIVRSPVLETDARPRMGDVARSDPVSHSEVVMRIRDQERGDFQGKEGRLPIKGLSLDSTQELVISRAKLRPCLVMARCEGVKADTIRNEVQRKHAEKALKPTYLLAPLFSVTTADEPGAFGPIVSARIRCLMYPEFFYLRQSGGVLRYPSVARLDRIFVRAPHPGSGFELEPLFVLEEVMTVALEQLRGILGQKPSKELEELRAMMLSFLPAEAAVPAV